MRSWTIIDRTGARWERPADGQTCVVITESGSERTLIYKSSLWWLPDMSMYVYFVPLMWRPLEGGDPR